MVVYGTPVLTEPASILPVFELHWAPNFFQSPTQVAELTQAACGGMDSELLAEVVIE